ncbi:HEAT repeat domain-containing protein [Myxococcus sp. AB025B]|uniref:HEAT repeat domain-containing protein n=1 Tax=Myxococcus sp. AB025B TaxID=2562794 RepID=UPI001143B6FC|nr:HEAT repeat domain-containing protein [Myxococcus sp. AB025B]
MLDWDLATVRLLDEDVTVRREAAGTVDGSRLDGRYALRQALLTDEDAQVRAIAARRLGDARDGRFAPALLESLGDAMPMVRDRAWRALARLGAKDLLAPATRAVRQEPVWWVRRAAVRASASVAGADAVEVLLAALEDPFWRVRHASVQALAWLGAEDEALRQEVRQAAARHTQGPVRAAVAWLESEWNTGARDDVPLPAPLVAPAVAPGAEPLSSEDPAVTTARLEARSAESVSARELVEWLGDPHEPLRALARRRLRERKDVEAIRLAMRWLDEPRVPHAREEAQALLDRPTVDEVALAKRVLESLPKPRPGALAWAGLIAVKHGLQDPVSQLRAWMAHPDAAYRRAALGALVHAPAHRRDVLNALGDGDETVREEVIAAWEQRPKARAAFDDFVEALMAFAPKARTARERRAVASAAAHQQDLDVLRQFAWDEDSATSATALAALSVLGGLSDAERQQARAHEDPWLRAAVLDVDDAAHVCLHDADATVRRQALEWVLTHARELADEGPATEMLARGDSPGAGMRTRATGHPSSEDNDAPAPQSTEEFARNGSRAPRKRAHSREPLSTECDEALAPEALTRSGPPAPAMRTHPAARNETSAPEALTRSGPPAPAMRTHPAARNETSAPKALTRSGPPAPAMRTHPAARNETSAPEALTRSGPPAPAMRTHPAARNETSAPEALTRSGPPDAWMQSRPAERPSPESAEAPALDTVVALACCGSPDPWIRARAAEHLSPEGGDTELRALLCLSRDTELMVRTAAASPLESCETLDARLDALLRQPATDDTVDLRIAAWTWRLRRADDDAFARLRESLGGTTESPRVVPHLRALALTFPEPLFADEPELARQRPTTSSRPRERPAPRPFVPRASARPLGRTGLTVSPLVLSGAHLTTREPFFEARDAGIDTFFWEPRYAALTQFLRGGRSTREQSVIIAGTYHSGAAAIRRDVESALRRLRTTWLDVFLLFWVRAPERLSDENHAVLEQLRAEGKLRAFGFSTHLRDLARDALDRHDWPVVMTRHSAAHPGAEVTFLPEARRRGTGVLTFTTTSYGRLLKPIPGEPQDTPLPTAVDCYRYSLSQPGVSASLTAPRNRRELLHNLDVLSRPSMEADALGAMRAHGERVRAQGRLLDSLVRRAPGGPREALLALMDEEGPAELDDLPSS